MESLVKLVVGLAWPAVAVFVLLFFRAELGGLVNRLRSAGRGGVEFEPQPTPRGDPSSTSPVTTADQPGVAPGTGNAGEALNPRDHITPIYRDLYDEMVARLRGGLPDLVARFDGRTEDVLVAVAGELGATLYLERASRSIFRSQVEALDVLKWQPGPLSKESFRPFYDRAAQTRPDVYPAYDFDRWFGFLVGMDLVAVQDETVTITQAGQVLSRYMADRGYVPVAV